MEVVSMRMVTLSVPFHLVGGFTYAISCFILRPVSNEGARCVLVLVVAQPNTRATKSAPVIVVHDVALLREVLSFYIYKQHRSYDNTTIANPRYTPLCGTVSLDPVFLILQTIAN